MVKLCLPVPLHITELFPLGEVSNGPTRANGQELCPGRYLQGSKLRHRSGQPLALLTTPDMKTISSLFCLLLLASRVCWAPSSQSCVCLTLVVFQTAPPNSRNSEHDSGFASLISACSKGSNSALLCLHILLLNHMPLLLLAGTSAFPKAPSPSTSL